jgi:hypothetical protein
MYVLRSESFLEKINNYVMYKINKIDDSVLVNLNFLIGKGNIIGVYALIVGEV